MPVCPVSIVAQRLSRINLQGLSRNSLPFLLQPANLPGRAIRTRRRVRDTLAHESSRFAQLGPDRAEAWVGRADRIKI